MSDDRKTYIGSSDARHILSGDWDKMWRKKLNLLPDDDLSDNFAVQLGVVVEPFHVQWTMRRLNVEHDGGFEVSTLVEDGDTFRQHYCQANTAAGTPIGSHPDALIRHTATEEFFPLEVKHTARWGNAAEAAQFYMPQLQHHMYAWGKDKMLFSVIVGNAEPERLWIGQSPEWIAHYVAKCDEFWTYVRENRAPSPVLFGSGSQPVVPTKIADTVPINGFKRRDISTDNYAQALIPEFLETKAAAKRHDQIKEDLKKLMGKDENELYSPSITLKRDARGAIRITIRDDEAQAA